MPAIVFLIAKKQMKLKAIEDRKETPTQTLERRLKETQQVEDRVIRITSGQEVNDHLKKARV